MKNTIAQLTPRNVKNFSFKPGQWGHLTVPSIGQVPHPFTLVPGDGPDSNVRRVELPKPRNTLKFKVDHAGSFSPMFPRVLSSVYMKPWSLWVKNSVIGGRPCQGFQANIFSFPSHKLRTLVEPEPGKSSPL